MEARCGKASVAFVPCGERPHVRLLLRGLKLVDGRVLLLTLHILPDGCVNLQDNVFAAEPGGKEGSGVDIRPGAGADATERFANTSLSPTNRRWSTRRHGYALCQATCRNCCGTTKHAASVQGHGQRHGHMRQRVHATEPSLRVTRCCTVLHTRDQCATRHPHPHTGRRRPRAESPIRISSQMKQQCLCNGKMLWVPVKGGWALQYRGDPGRALKAGKGGQRKRDKAHAPEKPHTHPKSPLLRRLDPPGHDKPTHMHAL